MRAAAAFDAALVFDVDHLRSKYQRLQFVICNVILLFKICEEG